MNRREPCGRRDDRATSLCVPLTFILLGLFIAALRAMPGVTDLQWLLLSGTVLIMFLSVTAKGLSMGLSPRTVDVLVCVIVMALCLRLPALPNESYDYRVFLSQWVDTYGRNGGFAAMNGRYTGNYNVPYQYFLILVSYLPGKPMYYIKLLSILFDAVLAFSLLKLFMTCSENAPTPKQSVAVVGLTMLLPTILANGAYYCQCDTVFASFCVMAVTAVLQDKPAKSCVMLGLALMFKLQAVFIFPLWLTFLIVGRVRLRHLFLCPLTYLAADIPALLLGSPVRETLLVYVGQTVNDQVGLAQDAPSLAMALSELNLIDNMGDTIRPVAAAMIAVTMTAVLALVLYAARRKTSLTKWAIVDLAMTLGFLVPYLLPYMRERYFIIGEALSVIWLVREPSTARKLTVASSQLAVMAALQLGTVGRMSLRLFHALVVVAAASMAYAVITISKSTLNGLRARPGQDTPAASVDT